MLLFINHLPTTLPADLQIKLTRENPFFTDAGDYTLDITLPLTDTPRNMRIFGPIHHIEENTTDRAGILYPFTLISPPLNLEGTCRITGITDHDVKIQLLASRTALNNALPDDTYIDQLTLPPLWNEHTYSPDRYGQLDVNPAEDGTFTSTRDMYQYVATLQRLDNADAQAEADRILYGAWPSTSAVALPIRSTTDEENANIITCSTSTPQQNPTGRPVLPLCPDRRESLAWPLHLAPQPYLIEIIRRILQAAGYTLNITEELRRSTLATLIITNCRPTLHATDYLPHWTLREFITEVQNFTATVFTVDGTIVSIIPRTEWYADNATTIALLPQQIINEYTRQLDNEADTLQATAGNIDYQWPEECPQLRLPDEVWQQAEVRTFSTGNEAATFSNSLTDEQKAESRYIIHEKQYNYTYAHLLRADGHWKYTRIDTMPPLIRRTGNRDIDTELHIVPCRQAFGPMPQSSYINSDGNTSTITPPTDHPYLTTTDTLRTGEAYSVNQAINPDSEETTDTREDTRRDIIEIAIYDGTNYYPCTITALGTTTTYNLPQPDSCPFTINPDTHLLTRIPIKGTTNRLSLAPGYLWGNMHRAAPTINTAEQLTLTFITRTPPPTAAIYNIRGRRYACRQIEITLTTRGNQPLVTGTFHPIE